MKVILTIEDEEQNTPFVIAIEEFDQLVIGRYDPETDTAPDIDLNDYGGFTKGVSRSHAAIIKREDALSLVDLESSNGTYLNKLRLFKYQPRVLQHGDQICVGQFLLSVQIE